MIINFLVSFIAIVLFILSTYGWGCLAAYPFLKEEKTCWSYYVALGLSCWIFIGGILNAVALAYPLALFSLFFSGIIFFCLIIFITFRKNNKRFFSTDSIKISLANFCSRDKLLIYAIPIALMIFLMVTLMPTYHFNWHDDFFTYFPRSVRMLQTGTIGGNPLSNYGIDSLGPQFFLQAFILLAFPVKYLNSFDAVFCFVISAFLFIEIGHKFGIRQIFIAIGLVALIIINPLIVNISSVYSGSLMILAIIFSTHFFSEACSDPYNKKPLIRGIHTALFLSSLIALKMTHIFFVAAYLLFFFGFSILFNKKRKHIIVNVILLLIATAVFLSPWIYTSLEKYKNIIFRSYINTFQESNSSVLNLCEWTNLKGLFSFKEVYGIGSLLDYNFTVILLTAAVFIILFVLRANKDERYNQYNLLILSAGSAGIISYITLTYLFPQRSMFGLPRYICPIFIAVFPLVAMFFLHNCKQLLNFQRKRPPNTIRNTHVYIIIPILIGVVFGLFADKFILRLERAYYFHTTLHFGLNKNRIKYNMYAMSSKQKTVIHDIQNKTEKKEAIMAWMSSPFHLDFGRNSIFNLAHRGVANRWVWSSFNKNGILNFLRDARIRYIMWEYNSPGMKKEEEFIDELKSPYKHIRKHAEHSLSLIKAFSSMMRKSKLIYNDGMIIVFDIGKNA